MKIAILGGTHGNEFVGIEVIRDLEKRRPRSCIHEFQIFHANPEAYKQRRRYVDSDLNRAFGKNSQPRGNEKHCSELLKSQIVGKFDFLIDLHTTTTNMGLTVILNYTNELSLKAACFLQEKFPTLKIITSEKVNVETPYTGSMVTAGLTIEVGPVANSVNKASLILTVKEMVDTILSFDFEKDFNYSKTEYYQTVEDLFYPQGGEWYVHPSLENRSFKKLIKGDPVFINIQGDEISFDRDYEAYPFFIGEAAYQEAGIAMSLSKKIVGIELV